MPNYRTHGKILTPLSDEEWTEYMEKGQFVERNHKGFLALLFYTGVRQTEARRALKEQFRVRSQKLIFEVGKRLKHGLHTPPLNIPLDAAFVNEIVWAVDQTKPKRRVWPFCDKTAWNIVNRVLPGYPHYFRLSRITNFFDQGWTIAQVRTWTGLSLKALNFYIGLVDIDKMGDSLGKTKGG